MCSQPWCCAWRGWVLGCLAQRNSPHLVKPPMRSAGSLLRNLTASKLAIWIKKKNILKWRWKKKKKIAVRIRASLLLKSVRWEEIQLEVRLQGSILQEQGWAWSGLQGWAWSGLQEQGWAWWAARDKQHESAHSSVSIQFSSFFFWLRLSTWKSTECVCNNSWFAGTSARTTSIVALVSSPLPVYSMTNFTCRKVRKSRVELGVSSCTRVHVIHDICASHSPFALH